MLRKNPELRPSAAELLIHPHLQPYVLKIHLNLNRPRQTIPTRWSDSNYIKRTRFVEPETISIHSVKVKRMSFSNDRTLNPSISGTEQDSLCSSQRVQEFEFPSMNQKFAELSVGCMHKEYDLDKSIISKFSSVSKTPRLTPRKISATPKRQTTPSKISHIVSKRDSLPMSQTPLGRSQATRRASLPLPTRAAASGTPYRANVGLLGSMESTDISVNAPQIDKIAKFHLASSEDPLYPIHQTSSTSAHCSSNSPDRGDCSITKDKCTVQVMDRTFARPNPTDASNGAAGNVSECSEHNPTGVSSRSSSESQQRRFDTSSYQQRAEALEGLLEFSARLLQQERLDELGVLLKPFGPEKVSPRETAIWLTKSFKETAI